MKLQKRIITYKDFDISYNELLTMKEAAEMLGIKLRGLSGLIDRNTLSEIVDADARSRGRHYASRLVLREEVEALVARRAAEA